MRRIHGCTSLLLLLGVLLLGACGQGEEIATVAVPGTDTVSPLPTATTAVLEPAAQPTPAVSQNLTPQPDLGIVQGVLTMDGQPAQGETLYLVPMVVSGESMSVAGLDTNVDPRATVEAGGTFTFLDVPPGEYALAIIGPVGPVVIRGANDDEITIEVKAGELAELGTVAVPAFNP